VIRERAGYVRIIFIFTSEEEEMAEETRECIARRFFRTTNAGENVSMIQNKRWQKLLCSYTVTDDHSGRVF
jgi:hypothetical protein